MTHTLREQALTLLRRGSGIPTAEFRDGQWEAIEHLVEGRGRLLVVQRTGWGKSFVYFIAGKLLREAGYGPSLLISPLLSLMRNQLAAAERMGVRAARIDSSNPEEWEEVEAALSAGQLDLLLVSPERLANEHFRREVLPPLAQDLGLLVIDEAHCISDWGHDFRPHYRLIDRLIRNLPPRFRLLATTATANRRVCEDLEQILGPNLVVLRGDLNRPSLRLQTISLPSQAERLAWLAEVVPSLPGSGIIYTLTVRDTDRVADWLKQRRINVAAYHANAGDRPALEDALLTNRLKVLVATTALGMGYDKPDLGFVIHYQQPGSPIAYYQQIGRAGRALDDAYAILLTGREDDDINDYFITTAFPTPDEADQVIEALERSRDGLTLPELNRSLNLRAGRIEHTLDLLSLESPAPLVKVGKRWQLTVNPLADSFWDRAERLTELRRAEQEQMRAYGRLRTGHMDYLIRALDGDGVVEARDADLPAQPSPGLVRRASEFLRRTHLAFEPRRNWPAHGLPVYDLRGRIDPDCLANPGLALCAWRDAGWGELVYAGKHRDGRFADELVDACVEMVRRWRPVPAPAWVTCVCSERHPELVPDFASRLAGRLRLPFVSVLERIRERPPQKDMQNSIQQALNLDGALLVTERPSHEPVLLVDDMVDSGWTMTIAAWLLRAHGSGEVWPLALAKSGFGT